MREPRPFGEPLSAEQERRFLEALDKAQEAQKEAERKQKEQPRIDFMQSAVDSGFTDKQAEFLWEYLAPKGHLHWDGRIGW